MKELLEFLIQKKTSIVHRVTKGNLDYVYKKIIDNASKNKPIISRILPEYLISEYGNRNFQKIKPNYGCFGCYVVGNSDCNLFIKQSINHCILYKNQNVDMDLFDVEAVYNEDLEVEEILYKGKRLGYKFLPEELIKYLSDITKSMPHRFIKEFKNLNCKPLIPPIDNKIEELIKFMALGNISVTYKSLDENKPIAHLINYLQMMNKSINICTLNKNDKTWFVDQDFSLLTDFFATKLLRGEETCASKVVIPLFGVNKYKNIVKNKEFTYVGYANNNSFVPFSEATILLKNNIIIAIKSDIFNITLNDSTLTVEGDLTTFLEKNKNSFNISLLNSLLNSY